MKILGIKNFSLLGRWCLGIVAAFFLFALSYMGYLIFIFSPLKKPAHLSTPILQESMKGVHVERYNESGRLIQEVKMDAWKHYQNETIIYMSYPFFTLYNSEGIWEISAKRGTGFQTNGGKFEELHLIDNVVVKQDNLNKNNPWILHTQYLYFFPQQSKAFTDDFVKILHTNARISAKGLRAQLDTQVIEFLKDVRCEYTEASIKKDFS